MSLFLQVINSASEASSATGTAAPSNEVSISLLDMASKGGPILIPIAILSVLAVYIFFERLFVIQKASKLDANFMNQIKQYVNA
ncbi:MAG: MotA/TolQ/ExbB proton channel family protein, partial [Bacteroidota bacterium]